MAYQDDRAKHVSVEAPAEPFTLPHFIGWLRERDPNEEYDWLSIERCALKQYALAHGAKNYVAAFGGLEATSPFEHIAMAKPNTFGGCLSRALSLQTEGR